MGTIRNIVGRAARRLGLIPTPAPAHIIDFPATISLPFKEGTLLFEVNNPVERYRTVDYGDEKEFLDEFVLAIRPDDVVFDIGASVGLMTVFAAAAAPKGKIFAFEPDPETMTRLKRNVLLNDLSNVAFLPWALTDTTEELILYTDGAAGAAPSLRPQKNRLEAPKGKLKVRATSLDAEMTLHNLTLPTILKIDIEGAEILALRGARKLLTGLFGPKPRLVFMELHPKFLPSFGATADDVRKVMQDAGYSLLKSRACDDRLHEVYKPR
jgi:FkbM family methyltransferase